MSSLKAYLNQKVCVITTEGCLFVGTLEGFDHAINLTLRDAFERIISPAQPTEVHDLGSFIIRGELVAAVGLMDELRDAQIDWHTVRGDRLSSTRHPY